MGTSPFREQSRRMALCGLMAALSVVLLMLGGMIPLATFACPMLAMVCLLPVLEEYGPRTALILYAATSVLALLLVGDKELALFYAFLGYYPAIKPRLDRMRSPVLRTAAKCGIFTGALTAMYLLVLFLFRLEAVVEEFAGYSAGMLILLLVLANLTCLVLDLALTRLMLVYQKLFKKGKNTI